VASNSHIPPSDRPTTRPSTPRRRPPQPVARRAATPTTEDRRPAPPGAADQPAAAVPRATDNRPTIKQLVPEVGVHATAGATENGEVDTSRLELITEVETTPAPLPPSPEAEIAAASWFESVPTSAAVPPQLGRMRPGSDSDPGSDATITPVRDRTGMRPSVAMTRPLVRPRARVTGSLVDRPWVIPALIAATALTVGMVLGAIIFGGAPAPARDDAAGVCAPRPASGEDASPPRPHRRGAH